VKRLYIRHAYEIYTRLKQVLIDLDLKNKDYLWLISDIEAYPRKKEYEELIENNSYLWLTTKELIDMLEADDFQWVWAVFSAIPSCFQKEDILKFALPCVKTIEKGKYDPHVDEPKLQHPYSDFELYAVDSSWMFIISENEEILSKFMKAYPNYTEE
jgi:hypothetical protein